jgi:hypothetical protein
LDGTTQPVWEGLAAHRWNESQLAALQTKFETIDQFDSLARALHGERLFTYHTIQDMMKEPQPWVDVYRTLYNERLSQPEILLVRAIPIGWLYQNQLLVDRFYTGTYLPAVDWERRRLSPMAVGQIEHSVQTIRATSHNIVFKLLLSNWVVSVTKKLALSQTTVDEAAVACALERYRLARGEFPETLDPLVPQFISKLPHDVIDGGPLHYRRTADGQYVLYSIGWNEVDDGGQVGLSNTHPPGQDVDKGDWVWFSQPQPQPSASERK